MKPSSLCNPTATHDLRLLSARLPTGTVMLLRLLLPLELTFHRSRKYHWSVCIVSTTLHGGTLSIHIRCERVCTLRTWESEDSRDLSHYRLWATESWRTCICEKHLRHPHLQLNVPRAPLSDVRVQDTLAIRRTFIPITEEHFVRLHETHKARLSMN